MPQAFSKVLNLLNRNFYEMKTNKLDAVSHFESILAPFSEKHKTKTCTD